MFFIRNSTRFISINSCQVGIKPFLLFWLAKHAPSWEPLCFVRYLKKQFVTRTNVFLLSPASDYSPPNYTWRERAVLTNGTISRKYNDFRARDRHAEAKAYLDYEVSILKIHEMNSKVPIKGKLSRVEHELVN